MRCLRLRADSDRDGDGAGGWSLTVPDVGTVNARACLQIVEVLDDEALVTARVTVEPGSRSNAERGVGSVGAPGPPWSSTTWP